MAASRPSFVFTMTDTQGTNVVGCYGRPELRTPHIDALAEQGLRFENAYTTCPVCTPARAGIFTGMFPHVSGPWANNLALTGTARTMGQRFRDGGYRTAYIGKWHLDGHDYFGTGECPDGWDDDYWFDGKRYIDELGPEQALLWHQGLKSIDDLREHKIDAAFTWAGRIADRAERFLASASGDEQPFLLAVSLDEPHGPFTCPPEFVEPFLDHRYTVGPAGQDDLSGKPEHHRLWAAGGEGCGKTESLHRPLYFGCNSFADDQIGRVLRAVDEHAPRNTYVIFTSDHGDMLGAHQIGGKGPAMYEQITRIPLIIRGPRGGSPTGVVGQPVSHIDLLPSMLDLAGLDTPPILHGQSLVPTLRERRTEERDVFLCFNRFAVTHDSWGGLQPIRGVRRGRHKFVMNLLWTDELYDLEADPHELENLIDEPSLASLRDELHDAILDWQDRTRDPFRGLCWDGRHWQDGERHKRGWAGSRRDWPADGYAPPVRAYGTGLPYENPPR